MMEQTIFSMQICDVALGSRRAIHGARKIDSSLTQGRKLIAERWNHQSSSTSTYESGSTALHLHHVFALVCIKGQSCVSFSSSSPTLVGYSAQKRRSTFSLTMGLRQLAIFSALMLALPLGQSSQPNATEVKRVSRQYYNFNNDPFGFESPINLPASYYNRDTPFDPASKLNVILC